MEAARAERRGLRQEARPAWAWRQAAGAPAEQAEQQAAPPQPACRLPSTATPNTAFQPTPFLGGRRAMTSQAKACA
jgi:hypothetical protein